MIDAMVTFLWLIKRVFFFLLARQEVHCMYIVCVSCVSEDLCVFSNTVLCISSASDQKHSKHGVNPYHVTSVVSSYYMVALWFFFWLKLAEIHNMFCENA